MRYTLQTTATVIALLLLTTTLSGCLVAGYSTGSGFFIWPGSIVITLIALLVFFLLRRGR